MKITRVEAIYLRQPDVRFLCGEIRLDPMGQDEKTDIALVREARKGLADGADLLIDAGLE
jgi:hypothetical protein